MKRVAGIAILSLLLLHWAGYRWVDQLAQWQADSRMQDRIEAGQYNTDQLIELSVSLDLPYTTNWGKWETVAGEVTINGIAYRYVERKLEDGKMYVRCLPNLERQKLVAARLAANAGSIYYRGATSEPNTILLLSQQVITDMDDHFFYPQIRSGRHVVIKTHALADAVCNGHDWQLIKPPANL